jgi:hypothetical protein
LVDPYLFLASGRLASRHRLPTPQAEVAEEAAVARLAVGNAVDEVAEELALVSVILAGW